jgi:hypothetical protein
MNNCLSKIIYIFLFLIFYLNIFLYLNEKNKNFKIKNEVLVFAFENFKMTHNLKKIWFKYEKNHNNTLYDKDIKNNIILLFNNAKKYYLIINK